MNNQSIFFTLSSALQSAVLNNVNIDDIKYETKNIYESIREMYKKKDYQISIETIHLGTGSTKVIEGLAKSLFKKGDKVKFIINNIYYISLLNYKIILGRIRCPLLSLF